MYLRVLSLNCLTRTTKLYLQGGTSGGVFGEDGFSGFDAGMDGAPAGVSADPFGFGLPAPLPAAAATLAAVPEPAPAPAVLEAFSVNGE